MAQLVRYRFHILSAFCLMRQPLCIYDCRSSSWTILNAAASFALNCTPVFSFPVSAWTEYHIICSGPPACFSVLSPWLSPASFPSLYQLKRSCIICSGLHVCFPFCLLPSAAFICLQSGNIPSPLLRKYLYTYLQKPDTLSLYTIHTASHLRNSKSPESLT